jgi:hypothetical protein
MGASDGAVCNLMLDRMTSALLLEINGKMSSWSSEISYANVEIPIARFLGIM